MRQAKRILAKAVHAPGAAVMLAPFMQGRATVLMLHRFAIPDLGIRGHSPSALRRLLEYVRRQRLPVIGLQELVERALAGLPIPSRAVSFTLDDGYDDQATVGLPLFARYDCAATTFVTTGFLDGRLWFWWDRIEYILETTCRRDLAVPSGEEVLNYAWSGDEEREAVRIDFTRRCKQLADGEKEAAIAALALAADVELPVRAPARYAPMSWERLRTLENAGLRFGAHTTTHPILARTPDRQAETEIVGSWSRLQAQAKSPVPVFCYPNGQPGDYGEREFRLLQHAGLAAAVVGTPGYVTGGGADRVRCWEVPRFAYADDMTQTVQYIAGLERLKEFFR